MDKCAFVDYTTIRESNEKRDELKGAKYALISLILSFVITYFENGP